MNNEAGMGVGGNSRARQVVAIDVGHVSDKTVRNMIADVE